MVDLINLGTRARYNNKVAKYDRLWGKECWAIIYQADVRFRHELVEQLAVEEQVRAEKKNETVPPKKWARAWAAGLNADKWWKEQVEDPCQAFKLKLRPLSQILGGDAMTAGGSSEHLATSNEDTAMVYPYMPPSKFQHTRRNGTLKQKAAVVHSGVYTSNNAGSQLCSGYNKGECSGNGTCQRHTGAHQCNRCLRSDHWGP